VESSNNQFAARTPVNEQRFGSERNRYSIESSQPMTLSLIGYTLPHIHPQSAPN
jgi:hypothetical protein